MLIIGHRGARAKEPENTLSALAKGMECADFVEIDVRVSRDNELVAVKRAGRWKGRENPDAKRSS